MGRVPMLERRPIANAIAKNSHTKKNAWDLGLLRRGVFERKDDGTRLRSQHRTNSRRAVLEITLIGRIMRHLNHIHLPQAPLAREPEMPLDTALGRFGKVRESQPLRLHLCRDGKTVTRLKPPRVKMEVDVAMSQEKARGEGADKMDFGTAGLPTLGQARGAEKGVRDFGGALGTDD